MDLNTHFLIVLGNIVAMNKVDMSTNNRHDTLNDVRVFLQREAPDRARTIEVVCSSARRDMDRHATHTPYRLFSQTMALFPECEGQQAPSSTSWPTSTSLCCWHDCHPFTTTPIPIPKVRSKQTNTHVFVVYGIFCSANCAVAYILEKNTYDQQLVLLQFKTIMVDVFGLDADSVFALEPAAPRIFLTMFGGHLSIDRFRDQSLTVRATLLQPPFISYSMVLEENARVKESGGCDALDGGIAPITSHVIRGLRRPTKMVVDEDDSTLCPHSSADTVKPSLFDQFVLQKVTSQVATEPMCVEPPPAPAKKRGSTNRAKRGAAAGEKKELTATVGGGANASTGSLAAYLSSNTVQ